jgi:hypothetical protein
MAQPVPDLHQIIFPHRRKLSIEDTQYHESMAPAGASILPASGGLCLTRRFGKKPLHSIPSEKLTAGAFEELLKRANDVGLKSVEIHMRPRAGAISYPAEELRRAVRLRDAMQGAVDDEAVLHAVREHFSKPTSINHIRLVYPRELISDAADRLLNMLKNTGEIMQEGVVIKGKRQRVYRYALTDKALQYLENKR